MKTDMCAFTYLGAAAHGKRDRQDGTGGRAGEHVRLRDEVLVFALRLGTTKKHLYAYAQ